MRLDDPADGVEIVVRRNQHRFRQPGRNAAGIRLAGGEVGHRLGRHREIRIVVVAVIAALAFQDLAAPGIGARDAHGVERRLRPGGAVSHLFGAGNGVDQLLGELDAGLVQRAEEMQALGRLCLHRFDHRRKEGSFAVGNAARREDDDELLRLVAHASLAA